MRKLGRPWRCSAVAFATALAGCVHVPPPPAPGTGTLWGYVRLVPRPGVTPGKAGGAAYLDRRLRDVKFVDYHRPGFVVVHLGDGAVSGTARVTIEPTNLGPAFTPPYTAVGDHSVIVVENRDRSAHTLASAELGLLHRVAPGAELEIRVGPGAAHIHLLDVPSAEALVYGSPGPYAVVSTEGRWELRDLRPGTRMIHAWHPRFPATVCQVTVGTGEVRQVDLEIGVQSMEVEDAPR
jgi:hypothetical protein